MKKFSHRSAIITPFIVMDVMQAAAEQERSGSDVIHMEVGQPFTAAPSTVLAAASSILASDQLSYTVAMGLPELRERISVHYRDFYGLIVPMNRIAVTTGSSAGFVLAFIAAFDYGDRVAIASPNYPCYHNILSSLGIEIVVVPCYAESRYQVTPEALKQIDGSIDGLIVTSPSNPTGSMLDFENMKSLVKYCTESGIRLISDEIYHGITYGTSACTAATFSEDAIIINSFSKYFSMTGWRIGWMVVPHDLIRTIERLTQNLYIAAPTLSQYAAVAAFDAYEEMNTHVERYARNRNILLNELYKAGIKNFAPPDGAFYLYADISHLTDNSSTFCSQLLKCTGIAITPGIDFEADRGKRMIRFSYSGSTEDVVEAMKRLTGYLQLR